MSPTEHHNFVGKVMAVLAFVKSVYTDEPSYITNIKFVNLAEVFNDIGL